MRPSGPAGTRPANRADLRAPIPAQRVAALAHGFAALFLEVEAGQRPRKQLAALLTPMLYARLSNVWVRGGAVGTVQATRVVGISHDSADVVVLVRRQQRCTAMSLRLRRTERGWLVDDVAVPEHGALPLPPYPVSEEPNDPDECVVVPSPARAVAPSSGPSPDWFQPSHPG